MNRVRTYLAAAGLFAAVWAVVTWPQPRVLATEAYPHQDVYFNMWRLEWLAHAARHEPSRLLDGNMFYPEKRTLTYSDAIPLEGAAAAPLIWLGARPVLVQNTLIFGAMIVSACTMFALVRYLTGSAGAGIVSGLAFGFAPYRFEHVMHLELQWAMWSPLAFLYLHRTFDGGRLKDGVLTGVMVALQMLSSIYYGVFLATLLGLGASLFFIARRLDEPRRVITSLAAGALLATVICGVYAVPYFQTRNYVGERTMDQVATFSARPSNYLNATPENWLYGHMLETRGRQERRLFPGTVITVLAIIGLLLRKPPKRAIIYLLLLVTAFEMSLGFSGHVYGLLYRYVPVYRGLRAVARLGIYVLLFLGVLGGYGFAALSDGWRERRRIACAAIVVLALAAEYRVSLPLSDEYPNTAPAVYRLLARQPPGVVAEFPMPKLTALPGSDPQYLYCSIFHWFPLVNGYSGVYPRSYLFRLNHMREFPDSRSFLQLELDNVRYIVLHEWPGRDEARRALSNSPYILLGEFGDSPSGTALLYAERW
ncbi:MAG TPA: hypothetical protein VL484_09885 [Vicinamibacterales bacterium]|nr:hypothetical protein [Vicinamibacterales bacterium]